MKMACRGARLVAAMLVLPACGKQVEEAPAFIEDPICTASDADPRSLSGVARLEGEYRLLLTVREGGKTEASTAGTLTLVRRDSAGVPFYGWTDVDLSEVDAHQLGALDSRSMESPGVLVLTTGYPDDPGRIRGVTIRLGSNANRSGMAVFDGAYTALYVRWISEGGFGGDWASGVRGPEVTGDFCAIRALPSE